LAVETERRILFNDATGFLRLDPSVDVQARGPNNIQTDVSIRGGAFGQTLVLWNGLRLNDAQTGHHNLDTPIPLESLDHIEILKGSGSTLYGSDAVGGVVNFISQPPDSSEARLRTSVGNFGVNQQHLELLTAQKGWTEDLAADRDFLIGVPDSIATTGISRWTLSPITPGGRARRTSCWPSRQAVRRRSVLRQLPILGTDQVVVRGDSTRPRRID